MFALGSYFILIHVLAFLGQETVFEGYWGLICIHFDLSDVSLADLDTKKRERLLSMSFIFMVPDG